MEKFIEWLNITKGNGHNAYDYTFDLSQTKTKNIAKKNFSVLFSGVFYVWVEDNIRKGENLHKGSGNRLHKRKTDTKTQKNDYTKQRS